MKISNMMLVLFLLIILPISAFAVSIPISINTTNSTITISYESSTTTLNFTPNLNTTVQINYTNTSCTTYTNTTTVNIDYELIKAKTVCSLNYNLTCPVPSCPQASCPTCPSLDYAAIDNKVQERVMASSEQIVTSLSGKLLDVNQSLANAFTSRGFSFPDLSSLAPYALAVAAVAFMTRKKWLPLLNKATGASTIGENMKKEEGPK